VTPAPRPVGQGGGPLGTARRTRGPPRPRVEEPVVDRVGRLRAEPELQARGPSDEPGTNTIESIQAGQRPAAQRVGLLLAEPHRQARQMVVDVAGGEPLHGPLPGIVEVADGRGLGDELFELSGLRTSASSVVIGRECVTTDQDVAPEGAGWTLGSGGGGLPGTHEAVNNLIKRIKRIIGSGFRRFTPATSECCSTLASPTGAYSPPSFPLTSDWPSMPWAGSDAWPRSVVFDDGERRAGAQALAGGQAVVHEIGCEAVAVGLRQRPIDLDGVVADAELP
jgi:hypothetical protein